MKQQRQAAIRKAVDAGAVKSQDELVRLLARQGFKVSQTTVSRDLRELGLARGRDRRGGIRYGDAASLGETRELDGVLKRAAPQSLLSVEPTGNLVVVRTTPGSAQGLAWALDAASLKGVAGTVAGDDTILVVCSAGADSKRIGKKLLQYATDQR
jgi:transcriptional regulator of arginine metabolism